MTLSLLLIYAQLDGKMERNGHNNIRIHILKCLFLVVYVLSICCLCVVYVLSMSCLCVTTDGQTDGQIK